MSKSVTKSKTTTPKKKQLSKNEIENWIDINNRKAEIPKRSLRNEFGEITFNLRPNNKIGHFAIVFDTSEVEKFFDVEHFIFDLSYYYRNRISAMDFFEEKIAICEEFINTLFLYSVDLRSYTDVRSKDSFDKLIVVIVRQFEYFKKQFAERKSVEVIEKGSKDAFSPNDKVSLLYYFGLWDLISNNVNHQKKLSLLLAAIFDRSIDNVIKSVRGVTGAPKEKDAVRNRNTLNKIREFAIKNDLKDVLEKVENDLRNIKQTKKG